MDTPCAFAYAAPFVLESPVLSAERAVEHATAPLSRVRLAFLKVLLN
jgi:hypothetical protein